MRVFAVRELRSQVGVFETGSASKVIIFDYDDTIVGKDLRGDLFDTEAEAVNKYNDYIGLGPHSYINRDTENRLRAIKEQGFHFCIATRKDETGAFEAYDFLNGKNLVDLFDFMVYEECNDNKSAMLDACVNAYSSGTQFTFLDDRAEFITTARTKAIHAIQVGNQKDNPYKGPTENSQQLAAALNTIPEFKAALASQPVDVVPKSASATAGFDPAALLVDFKKAHGADLQKTCFGKTRIKCDDSLASIVNHAMKHSGGFCGLFSTRSKRVLLKLLKDRHEIEGSSAKAKLKTLHGMLQPR